MTSGERMGTVQDTSLGGLHHGMTAEVAAWRLQPGMMLLIPNCDSVWSDAEEQYAKGNGLPFEVHSVKHGYNTGLLDVVAFGATMLTLTDLHWREMIRVVVPHVPAVCPICVKYQQDRHTRALQQMGGPV